jgi:hypothetical protein
VVEEMEIQAIIIVQVLDKQVKMERLIEVVAVDLVVDGKLVIL